MDTAIIPANQLPAYNIAKALERKAERNILLVTWGGIGDQVCAEPTLRYALKEFGKQAKISLATHIPELFRHLKFERVFDLEQEQPVYEKYLTFKTIYPNGHLMWEFINHCVVNCVDYPSLAAFKCMLPVKDKEIVLKPEVCGLPEDTRVVIHPGKHWPTKTFPKAWWDEIIHNLVICGFTPIIIGKNTDDNRGTVDVTTEGCLDLRNKMSLNDTAYLLQNCSVLLTNDSMPLHIAASGSAWIGYVATCKHPDYITHWRQGQWGWRMQNHGVGGIWENVNHLPNHGKEITVDNCTPEQLMSWLPEPSIVSEWAREKAYFVGVERMMCAI